MLTVPDTSVWITFLRQGAGEAFMRRGLRTGSMLLASVVAHELAVGATTAEDRRDLDNIRRSCVSAGLTVTPSFDDWWTAGAILERYGRLRGAIDPRAHLNDILVLLCAAQQRAVLVTWNLRDMTRWNRMLPVVRRVRVQVPPVRA